MCVRLTTDRPINTAWDWGRGLGRHTASSFPVVVSSFKGYQEARGKDTHPGLILIVGTSRGYMQLWESELLEIPKVYLFLFHNLGTVESQ